MNRDFSVFAILFEVAWFATGALSVFTLYRQQHASWWHWVLLIVGVAMLAIGALGEFNFWMYRRR